MPGTRDQKRRNALSVAIRLDDRFLAQGKDEELRAELAAAIIVRAARPFDLEGQRIEPLIESVNREDLAKMIDRATRTDPEYVPSDFGVWFQVATPSDVDPDELARTIRDGSGIETAYVMRPGPPPTVSPADDPRATNQGYLDAAPNGIDARFAWGFSGGDGAGVGWVDMEQGWNLSHEDLAAAGITLISGINNAYFFHGTSVLGEVAMVDNARGGVGIAPSATPRVISQQRTATSYNTADSIIDAAAHMAFGDVLLLEAQETDPVGGLYYWPVEIADATYAAIRLATALGVVVVEAACNGGYDLDAYTNLGGRHIFDRGSADFRDSGAIMVGAGSSASPHARLGFSNQGTRVDCYGWGENVDTTSTNSTGTDNTLYTSSFGGTSGASPIVSGAAVIVQGLAQASLGYRFSPREVRALLVQGGTASATPATDRIGVMPDLRAIINNSVLNLAPDAYLRDYVGDSGNPTGGSVSSSPDIIVRQAAVSNPTAAFGAGSGTENNAGLSDQVLANRDHRIYVRVRNRGGSAAAPVDVDVYWSPPSTLVSPNLWNLIGTVSISSVPTGNVLTVSNALLWPAAQVPTTGHYCFVAVAGASGDPRPDPTAFSTWDTYVTYVRNNNNVAWRNFDVVPPPPSTGKPPSYVEPFAIAGAFDSLRVFEIEAIGRLPEGSKVRMLMPTWLADGLGEIGRRGELSRNGQTVAIPLHPHGARLLGRVALPAKAVAQCELRVDLPKERAHEGYEFAVRQLYEGAEVGRVTWRFGGRAHTPPKPPKTSN